MSKVGIVQMTSGAEPDENIKQLKLKLKGLQLQGAKLVLTPENCIVFGKKDDYERYAEPVGKGVLQDQLSALARHYQLWLVIGSFPTRNENGSLSTTSLVFDDNGHLVEHYNKLHMFDVDVEDRHQSYRESDTFTAGDDIKVVDTPIGKVGLSICYDVRFPQLYSELRKQGAEIILVPAAFTKVTGYAHWDILLRSRAIETQCWVLAAGQWGKHGAGRETWGHSMIIDPWGNKVTAQQEGTGVIIADIDLEQMNQIRKKMPVAQHARLTSHLL
ncbi:carbon-nitrogen hydrolase family protein [Aliivibrio fischeri]|uniref:carbon-nitrogen hydrolase family protein n=1 Tax=Aliivibrio fischeri TaxID=668 RepID=UPI0002E5CC71|nr:carbon-nitrogen hydrolase family protein [Aliivibrio fischeri]OEE21157.1 amidohydrolase [Aliivibrio fischeri ZF-211]